MKMAQFSHFLLQEKSWLCKGVLLCCVFCRKNPFFISHLIFFLSFICEQLFTIPVLLFAVISYINSCWITSFTEESVKLFRFEKWGQIIPMSLSPAWSLPAVFWALQREKWFPAWEWPRSTRNAYWESTFSWHVCWRQTQVIGNCISCEMRTKDAVHRF